MIDKSHSPQTIILIPAYEPRNALIKATNSLLEAAFTVVVVDDGSGHGYTNIFDALDSRVHLITHATNKGKGTALKSGFRYIRETFSTYVVVTADADGQHHFSDIKKMAQAYRLNPHSFLLGVRTFENDAVPLRSKFGNTLTRKVFSLVTKQKLSDTQTGLRAFDESLIDFMINIPGERFEYEMNALLESSSEEVPLIELPILTIYENGNASSHFSPLKDSWSIYKEVMKFASSSILAFAIDFGVFILLLHITSSWVLASSITFANVVSRITSASFNFMVNKHLVFKQKDSLIKDLLRYSLLATVILLINTIVLNVLTDSLHSNPYVAKIITEVTLFSLSYIVQKNIIFSKKVGYSA